MAAHCRVCKQPLYQMMYLGHIYPASQCLNQECRLYGEPQPFKCGKVCALPVGRAKRGIVKCA